jgi:SAM-dependent methyltransferase
MDLDRPWRGERTYDPSVDISHDLLSMKPFPIESDSAGLAHSRYSIEHLTDEAALFFFKEVLRILKSKGIFRVVAPNIDLDYRAYQRGDRSFFYWQGPHVSLEQAYLIHIASNRSIHHSDSGPVQLTDADFRTILDSMPFEAAMDTIVSKCSMEKQLKYRDNHINWWNEPKLDAMLRKAGFKIVYRSAAEQSSSPVMRNEVYFDNRFQKCMFYMEAMKT